MKTSFIFSEYDSIALDNIIEIQRVKKHKYKTLSQILIVIDDFANRVSYYINCMVGDIVTQFQP